MGVSPYTWDGFTVYKGAAFSPLVYYKDSCGNPIDLTGYRASFQAKYNLDDDVTFIDLTTENDGITLGGADGTIQMFLPDGDSDDFIAGYGQYSLKLIPGGDADFYILEGRIPVKDMA